MDIRHDIGFKIFLRLIYSDDERLIPLNEVFVYFMKGLLLFAEVRVSEEDGGAWRGAWRVLSIVCVQELRQNTFRRPGHV